MERLDKGKVDGLVSEQKPDEAILESCLNKSKLVYSSADVRESIRSTNSLFPWVSYVIKKLQQN